ncbi:hypothetical protein ACFY00_08035 [Kitasatospora sp. NPDC001540]|uniref:hypothetical protein n=1 Tax=Kitasatospora sp. NPDC001540 TaxID=3364014 RepID=UPI003699A36A
METKMITKVTDLMTTLAMPSRVSASGLGLGTAGGNAGVQLSEHCLVSDLGNAEGTRVEAGLSRDWAMFVDGISLSDERPTQAPKAVAAEALHGRYVAASGAGNNTQDQQISLAEAAVRGAGAGRKQAFRGPGPWSERP